MTSRSEAQDTARAFVDARRAGIALPDYPGSLPASLDDAYVIQSLAIELEKQPISGWKVGRVVPPQGDLNRFGGPVFLDRVIPVNGSEVSVPVIIGGSAAVEAEFLLRVGKTPELGKTSYTIDEASALIDAVHVGIEIAGSPFPGIMSCGSAVTVSDFGNNHRLLVGPPFPDWPSTDLRDVPVAVLINEIEIGAATAASMLDGPIGAARFLLEHLAQRGFVPHAGSWISSGAVTGVHPVRPGDRVTARFGDYLNIRCRISGNPSTDEDRVRDSTVSSHRHSLRKSIDRSQTG